MGLGPSGELRMRQVCEPAASAAVAPARVSLWIGWEGVLLLRTTDCRTLAAMGS